MLVNKIIIDILFLAETITKNNQRKNSLSSETALKYNEDGFWISVGIPPKDVFTIRRNISENTS